MLCWHIGLERLRTLCFSRNEENHFDGRESRTWQVVFLPFVAAFVLTGLVIGRNLVPKEGNYEHKQMDSPHNGCCSLGVRGLQQELISKSRHGTGGEEFRYR